MTDERAGQLNEPNLMDECATASLDGHHEGNLSWINAGGSERMRSYFSAESVVHVLLKRGLINELGIEILKRDGVIK